MTVKAGSPKRRSVSPIRVHHRQGRESKARRQNAPKRKYDREYCRRLNLFQQLKDYRCNLLLPVPKAEQRPPPSQPAPPAPPAPSSAPPPQQPPPNPPSPTTSRAEPRPEEPRPSPNPPVTNPSTRNSPPPATQTQTPGNGDTTPEPELPPYPSQSPNDPDSTDTAPGGSSPRPSSPAGDSDDEATTTLLGTAPRQSSPRPVKTLVTVLTSDGGYVTVTSFYSPDPTDNAGGGTIEGPTQPLGATKKPNATGAIIGGVLGALAVLCLCAIAFVIFRRRMRRSRTAPSQEFMQRYGHMGAFRSLTPVTNLSQPEDVPPYTQSYPFHFPYPAEKA